MLSAWLGMTREGVRVHECVGAGGRGSGSARPAVRWRYLIREIVAMTTAVKSTTLTAHPI